VAAERWQWGSGLRSRTRGGAWGPRSGSRPSQAGPAHVSAQRLEGLLARRLRRALRAAAATAGGEGQRRRGGGPVDPGDGGGDRGLSYCFDVAADCRDSNARGVGRGLIYALLLAQCLGEREAGRAQPSLPCAAVLS
jgi:hypothetical protein